jgi:TusA-related sulfurtransferase
MTVQWVVDMVLDCKGLSCPLPVLKTKKAIESLAVGQILKMESTDAGSKNDMVAWAKRTGHELLEMQENGGVFTFFIKRAK